MGGNFADLQKKVDAWTSRAVQAVQNKASIEQDFAINIAKGYQIKLAELYDKPIEEEVGQWVDLKA